MFWKPKNSKFTALNYCLLGAAVAMAMMTKITGAVILFPVVIFHFKNVKSKLAKVRFRSYILDKRLYFFICTFLVIYIAGNPGIIFKIKSIFLWFFSFFLPADAVVKTPEFPQSHRSDSLIHYYFGVLFPFNNIFLNLFIWAGIILGFKKSHSNAQYLFLSYLVPYTVFLCTSKSVEHIYPRYVLPLIPILLIFGGLSFDFLANKLQKKLLGKIIVIALYLTASLPVIFNSIAFDRDLGKPDTRTYAKEWVHENISSDNMIIIEGGLYKTSPTSVPIKIHPDLIDKQILYNLPINGKPNNKNMYYKVVKETLKTEKTYHLILIYNKKQLLEALNEKSGDFIIIRDSVIKATLSDTNKKLFPELYRLILWAESNDFELIKIFEPNEHTVGPKLLIYKRKKS
jgi:hypothetical protein